MVNKKRIVKKVRIVKYCLLTKLFTIYPCYTVFAKFCVDMIGIFGEKLKFADLHRLARNYVDLLKLAHTCKSFLRLVYI